MFDTGAMQDYVKGFQGYARGVGDYARGVGDFAKGAPDRWPPTLTYQVEVRDQNWWKFLAAGIGLGVAASWLLMPAGARRNRAGLRNRFAHLSKVATRDLPEAAARKTDYMGGKATGMKYRVRELTHLNGGEEPPDLDQFIAHKVETEVFGRPDVPKGALNVDSVDGIVTVRGTVESQEVMQRIVKYIEGVDDVRDVVNRMKIADESRLAYSDPRR